MANASVITASPLRSTMGRVNSGARFWPSAVAVAQRTVRKFVRTPQLIGLATVQSAIFLVIFRYIFGGAINAGGLPYVDFLVPGFVTTGILFAGMGAAAGVAEDLQQGLFDRLRSLPIPRAAVLAGRGLADTALVTWSLAVGTALGFAVGFRLHGSVTAGLAAFGLCVLFSFAFEWVFITIGLVAGTAQAAQGMSVLPAPTCRSAACRAGCSPSPPTSRSPPWSTRSVGWPAGPRRRRCLPTPPPITLGSPWSGPRRSWSCSGCSPPCASHDAKATGGQGQRRTPRPGHRPGIGHRTVLGGRAAEHRSRRVRGRVVRLDVRTGCGVRPVRARHGVGRAVSPPDTDPLVRTDRRNQPQRERRSSCLC
jgi:hypothetical protein